MSLDIRAVGKGYSLWLIPGEPLFSRLAGEIARLSRDLATPLFEPHITLLGGITLPEEDVLARSVSLAGSLKPFQIELGDIGYLDEYFRCLFVRVVPAAPILKAHRAAQAAFRLRDQPAYMPHVSLVYGKLAMEMKEKIAAEFGRLAGQSFEANSLVVYQVRGTPCEWNLIKTLEFH